MPKFSQLAAQSPATVNALRDAIGLVVTPQRYGAVGDGVADDTAAINAAIAALRLAGGGALRFPFGAYLTQGGHLLDFPCLVHGDGSGTIPVGTNGGSVLSLKNGANADVFTLAAKGVTIKDLGLYGNKGNQTATSRGIVTSATAAANYFRIHRVWVDGFRDDGVFLQSPGTSLEGLSSHLKVLNCGGYGVNLANSAADCQFADCVLNSNALGGANNNAGSTVFSECHIWGNTNFGIVMPSGAPGYMRLVGSYIETNTGVGVQPRGPGNQIVGSYIWKNNGRGVYAFSNSGLVITGCVIRDNNRGNAAGAAGAGVNLDTCTSAVVTGNHFIDTGGTKLQTYGYAETGNTCNACIFSGNSSRAADHLTGSWLIGTGNPTATIPATPASFNAG